MKVLIKVFSLLLAVMFIAPNAQASIAFTAEYETRKQEYHWELDPDAAFGIDLLDLYTINNYNSTLKPLFENYSSLRGISQYPFSIPQKYMFDYVGAGDGGYGENITVAWPFTPNRKIMFGTAAEVWFRLPLNNISLDDTHTIRLAAWKLYTNDPYNLSVGETIDDTSLGSTAVGPMLHDVVFDFDIHSPDTAVPGFPTGQVVNHTIQHNLTVNISSNDKEVSVDYNFTYVRCNAPFETGVTYIMLAQLTTNKSVGEDIEYEFLWTDSDNNHDRVFLSQMNIGSTPFNVTVDFDTVAIITDLSSERVFSPPRFEGNYVYQFLFHNPKATLEAADVITFQIPFYSRVNGNVSFYLSVAESDTGPWDDIRGSSIFSFKPGSNVITVNFSLGLALDPFRRMNVMPWFWNESAPMVDFAFVWSDTVLTFIEEEHAPFNHLARLNAAPVLRYLIGTTEIEYFPLDQYSVFVVPDPYDIESARAFVEEANNIRYDILLRADPEDRRWTMEELLFIGMMGGLLSVYAFMMFGRPSLPGYIGDSILQNPFGKLINWVALSLEPFISASLWSFSYLFSGIITFIVHALSWLITNALHLLAIWTVISVYLLGVFAANGVCNAVVKSRRERKKHDIFNVKRFEEIIGGTFDRFIRLVAFNMSLIGAIFVILSTVLRMVSPI